MTATAQQGRAHWTALLRPRWLAWHAFTVLAIAGMLYLGVWQLHRAESGNELSWAYTFEWPLFAIFAGYFWVKSLRDELRGPASGGSSAVTGAADPVERLRRCDVRHHEPRGRRGGAHGQAARGSPRPRQVARLALTVEIAGRD